MQTSWSFTGLDESDEGRIADLWRSRGAELESKVQSLEGSISDPLCISVERAETAPAWRLTAALYLPAHAVVAEGDSSELQDALDRLVGQLAGELDRQGEAAATSTVARRDLRGIAAILKSCHERRRQGSFTNFLLPLVSSLMTYAQREVRARQSAGEIPVGEITAQDVLDEVLLRAWDQFDRKPESTALDLWLTQLIDRTIGDLAHPLAERSLEEREKAPAADFAESDRDQWTEHATETDTIELSRLIPDTPGIGWWDDLDVEAKRTQLDEMLSQLPRRQRQVLVLYASQGFSLAEIADFHDRSEADVRSDLAAARQAVQQMLYQPEQARTQERSDAGDVSRTRR